MAKEVTKRAENYSQWYNDLVVKADLAEQSAVRGCMVIKPYGYAIWEKMQTVLDGMFKATGLSAEEFNSWVPKLPEGAWMVYWDGDIYSTGSGWRALVKTDQIRNAFSSWRYLTDYRHFDDYDVDFSTVRYPLVSADFDPTTDTVEETPYNEYAWW